jgi:hypothetical protein
VIITAQRLGHCTVPELAFQVLWRHGVVTWEPLPHFYETNAKTGKRVYTAALVDYARQHGIDLDSSN